ncbi:recombinase family protein [Actinocorallia sp. API 0066]|uniref:recombinase family protein n=1 Tax=Actinocorallia sp. API 0066 TaxID=2896846 RepID=UPI001E3303B6|nr:recombinase family protein [Actinocorallia sp. API 0066]MCD0449645.1 recombinase family protein [Actinocorallia sp. API 0066]
MSIAVTAEAQVSMTHECADLTAEAVRLAMYTDAPMVIAGVPGRWVGGGDRWIADDPTGTDTIILARISSAEGDEIDGVARQVSATASKALFTGARPRLVLVENDTSAFKRKKIKLPNGKTQLRTIRPKFREALDLLERRTGLRTFLAMDLDRTFRDPRDLEDAIDVVEASKPRIVFDSVTGSLRLASDADITMARVLVAMANKSSRDTARRVSDARLEQAQEGRNGGGRRAYGWDEEGTPIPAELRFVRRAFKCAEAGVSMKELARDLNAAGSRKVNGKEWCSVSVRDMLLRPRNANLSVHRKDDEDNRTPYTREDVVGRYPGRAPVSEARYWAVVARLTDPARRTTPGNAVRWFGAGIYQCPCGAPMKAHQKHRKIQRDGQTVKTKEMTYRCAAYRGGGHVLSPMFTLDALVIDTLLTLIANSQPEDIIGKPQTGHIDPAALMAEIAEHRARLNEIADDYEEDRITKEQRDRTTAKRRLKLDMAQQQLDSVHSAMHPAAVLVTADDIHAAWNALTLGEQREIVRRLLTVTIQPVGRGKRLPIHERVTIEPIPPATAPEPTRQPTPIDSKRKARRTTRRRPAAAKAA